jgi:hypothetical protein
MESEKKKYIYSKEKRQEYNKTFYESHKTPIKCDICLEEYKYHNKHNHFKTKIHQMAVKLRNNINNQVNDQV